MTRIRADRVMETSATAGLGDIFLSGAVRGYRRFASVCSIGDTVDYTVISVDESGVPTGVWESGRGIYSVINTLTRTAVQASSNNGSFVNFVPDTKYVMLSENAASLGTTASGGTPYDAAPTLPSLANFTQENWVGTTSGIDGIHALRLKETANNAQRLRCLMNVTPPVAPYDMYSRLTHGVLAQPSVSGGIVLRNAASTKYVTFGFGQNGHLYVAHWNGPTDAYSGSLSLDAAVSNQYPAWFRVGNDGTNINFHTSPNGYDWQLVYTETLASFVGDVGAIGYFCINGAAWPMEMFIWSHSFIAPAPS